MRHEIFQLAERTPAKSRRRLYQFGPTLVRHFTHSFSKFYRGQKVRNLTPIFDPSRLWVALVWKWRKKHIWNLKLLVKHRKADDHWLRSSSELIQFVPRNSWICPPPLKNVLRQIDQSLHITQPYYAVSTGVHCTVLAARATARPTSSMHVLLEEFRIFLKSSLRAYSISISHNKSMMTASMQLKSGCCWTDSQNYFILQSYKKLVIDKDGDYVKTAQFLIRLSFVTALHMECRRRLTMRILYVRLSVRLANACIVTKRKKNLSRFLYHATVYLS